MTISPLSSGMPFRGRQMAWPSCTFQPGPDVLNKARFAVWHPEQRNPSAKMAVQTTARPYWC